MVIHFWVTLVLYLCTAISVPTMHGPAFLSEILRVLAIHLFLYSLLSQPQTISSSSGHALAIGAQYPLESIPPQSSNIWQYEPMGQLNSIPPPHPSGALASFESQALNSNNANSAIILIFIRTVKRCFHRDCYVVLIQYSYHCFVISSN